MKSHGLRVQALALSPGLMIYTNCPWKLTKCLHFDKIRISIDMA